MDKNIIVEVRMANGLMLVVRKSAGGLYQVLVGGCLVQSSYEPEVVMRAMGMYLASNGVQ